MTQGILNPTIAYTSMCLPNYPPSIGVHTAAFWTTDVKMYIRLKLTSIEPQHGMCTYIQIEVHTDKAW